MVGGAPRVAYMGGENILFSSVRRRKATGNNETPETKRYRR